MREECEAGNDTNASNNAPEQDDVVEGKALELILGGGAKGVLPLIILDFGYL